MSDPSNHDPNTGRFTPDNTANANEKRACTMRYFRNELRLQMKRTDIRKIWIKLVEIAKDGNLAAIKIVLETMCGAQQDMENEQMLIELETAIQQREAEDVVGRVG